MSERYLASSDYLPALSWQLCEWCRVRGADEFTLTMLGTKSIGDYAYDAMEAPLLPFQRSPATREHLSRSAAEDFKREARLWSCTPESLAVLPALFPLGPFAYPFGDPVWCEDLVLYREGELVLGTISHEDAGVLRLAEMEFAQLSAAGYPTRTSWPRG